MRHRKNVKVSELKSGQRVYDSEHGKLIHSGLAVEPNMTIKEPKEFIFYADNGEENPEQIIITDAERLMQIES